MSDIENPPSSKRTSNVLVCCTGSVATIKLFELVEKLFLSRPDSINIKIVLSERAKQFAAPDRIRQTFGDRIEIYDDEIEWSIWKKIDDPVLHVHLRNWADVCVIAPLSANTMGKIANGLCDNLVTCLVRAWDTSKPLFYCPAMNTFMYNHPITKRQLQELDSFDYKRIDCIEKKLACGDVGLGAMAHVDTIINIVLDSL